MPSPTSFIRRGRRGRLLWMANDDPEMDTAAIRVCNGLQVPIEVFGQLNECADCPLQSLSYGQISPHDNSTVMTLTSTYGFQLNVIPYNDAKHAYAPCPLSYHFDEYGEYVWNIGRHPICGSPALGTDGGGEGGGDADPRAIGRASATTMAPQPMDCELHVLRDGYPTYLPVLVYGLIVLLGLPLLWLLLAGLNRVLRMYVPRVYAFLWTLLPFLINPNSARTASAAAPSEASAGADDAANKSASRANAKSRVVCVDVLRGIAIAVMIFANYGAGSYALLDHAVWNGLHLADMAFPGFVFCMGLSIAITNRRDAQRLDQLLADDAPRPPNEYDAVNVNAGSARVTPLPSAMNIPWSSSEALVDERRASPSPRRSRLVRLALEYAKVFYRIVRRAALIFFIGFALSNVGFDEYKNTRIFGVLQRLALVYLLTGLISMLALLRYSPRRFPQREAAGGHSGDGDEHSGSSGARAEDLFQVGQLAHSKRSVLWDVLPFWPEWVAVLALLGVQLGFEFGANVPGCPRGYLGPGGLHWNASFLNCTGGAHRWIDVNVLGDNHLYRTPTAMFIYLAPMHFDPEGLLGTCSATFLCFLGLQAGKVLLFSSTAFERVVRLGVWALLCGALVLPLVLVKGPFDFNPSLIPINKNLWSESYSLVNGCVWTGALALLYILVDWPLTHPSALLARIGWPLWSGAPLRFLGANPMLLYVGHEVFMNYLPVTALGFLPDTHWGSLARTVWGVLFWTLVAYDLYVHRVFLTI